MRASLLALGWVVLLGGCSPAYIDAYAPEEASFDLSCVSGCGPEGRDNGLVVAVTFTGGTREYPLCCEHRAALRAHLQTVRDHWCDGLDVPAKQIGGLTVATTTSEITDERGATLDDGQGYVAFQCSGWLDELIAKLATTTCCGSGGGS